mmetsp:Transcript_69574/g.115201  ORF Transcript_69574/g.115201 Transcript_69574/m.115201 type:complete len:275 (+) Transcript_69574:66-890(+)
MALDFNAGAFFLNWLVTMTSDFLDASFLMTIAFVVYSPCCGFRDNDSFCSVDRFLVLLGCVLAMTLRTVLLFTGIDPRSWDNYCHVGAASMLFVFSAELFIKWRRAVYGRSQLATDLGRRMPEERASDAGQLEDGRRPLAVDDVPQTTNDGNSAGSIGLPNAVEFLTFYKRCVEKLSHLLVPGSVVLFVSARDGQTVVSEKLAHHHFDMGLGQLVGLICSTLVAALLGGFFRWYLHDRHLLFYMSLVFFSELVMSVQGSVVAVFMEDLPKFPEV